MKTIARNVSPPSRPWLSSATPRHEHAFAHGEIRTRGADGDVERAHHEDQHRDGERARDTEGFDLGDANVGGQQHEEQADQQDAKLILELAQISIHSSAHVPDHDPSHGNGQNATLGNQHVTCHEEQEDRSQGHDVLVAIGNDPAKAQQAREAESTEKACKGPKAQLHQHSTAADRQGVGVECQRNFEYEYGEDGANGIDQHPFCLEDRRNPRPQAQFAYQGSDDRGSGNGDEAAKQAREQPRPVE